MKIAAFHNFLTQKRCAGNYVFFRYSWTSLIFQVQYARFSTFFNLNGESAKSSKNLCLTNNDYN
jgi:hypothetical protein